MDAKIGYSPRALAGNLATTGKGVGVLVMDQGFDLRHADLQGRVEEIATSPTDTFDSDPIGHGTHVLGIVGGNGAASSGQIQGVAPEAKLLAMKVNVDQSASWQELADGFAKGVYWAVQNKDEFNIRVINCSIVFPTVIMTDPKTGAEFLCDPLAAAVKMATEAGISVVAGAGNFGSSQPIMTPACNSDVIAVGASDPRGTLTDLSDDTVAPFSSFGKGMGGETKPDILAPGVHILSANVPGSQLEVSNQQQEKMAKACLTAEGPLLDKLVARQVKLGRISQNASKFLPPQQLREVLSNSFDNQPTAGDVGGHPVYLGENGTSMAAPFVAGVVANMIEANPALTPSEIKQILLETAQPLAGQPLEQQGHGTVQPDLAVAEALRRKKS